MKDVADAARVSATTASLVLGGRADEFRIHPGTRRRVVEAADRLGYVASGKTRRSAASQPPPLWVVLAPSDLEAGPINAFLRGVNRYLRDEAIAKTYSLIPFEPGSLASRARWMHSSFAAGLIFVGLDDADLAFIAAQDFDIPVVLYNRIVGQHASVMVDDYAGGELVGAHYAARGIEQFVLLMTAHVSTPVSMRSTGFVDALRGHGVVDTGSVQRVALDLTDDEQMDAALDSIQVQARTGIFVLHDRQTLAVLRWARRHALRIPEDAELVIYGDTVAHRTNDPTLTSVSIPSEEMGYECAQTLQHLTASPTFTGVRRTFHAKLVERESSPAAEEADGRL